MPFERQQETFLGPIGQPMVAAEVEAEDDTSTLDVFSAAFRLDNTLVSSLNNDAFGLGQGELDPDFDPFVDIENTIYADFADRFADVNNAQEAAALKTQIDSELEDRQLLQQNGALGIVASVAAGVFDPVNLIPVGGAITKAIRGGSLLKGAATTASVGFLAETTSESVLQATQATRTAEETAINIAAGTFLAGAIGAGATAIARRQGNLDDLVQGVEKDLTIAPDNQNDALDDLVDEMISDSAVVGFDDSVGAARVVDTTLEQETLVSAFGLERRKVTGFLNPMLRMAHSPAKATRQISQQLIENPVFFNKNVEGIATEPAVETLIKESQGRLADAIEEQRNAYTDFKRNATKLGLQKQNFQEFKESVAKALRRGDVGENAFVTRAAKGFRSRVLNPLKERAIANDLLPEDVKVETADSYLHRVWNRNRIVQNEPEFRVIVNEWVRSQADDAIMRFNRDVNRRINALEARLATAARAERTKLQQQIDDIRIESEVEKRSFFDTENNLDEYVGDITDSIIRTLKGQQVSTPAYSVKIATRGPLKERVFNIRDEKVEDFLVNDTEFIAERYTRLLGTDVELQEKFGSVTLDDQLTRINDEYTELARQATTRKDRQRIERQRLNDIRDLTSMLDIMRGVSGKYTADPSDMFVRVGRQLRILQYLSKLGGVTVSSIPDIARPIMVHGFGRLVGNAILPAIRGAKGIRLSIQEARRAGQVTEHLLGGRIATLAEIADPYAQGTAFERFTQNLANGFSRVTVLSQWNNFWKGTSSVITQARLIDNVEAIAAGKNLSRSERQYMAFLGIDRESARGMARELRRAGKNVDGVKIANTDEWENESLRRLFRAAINKDVDRTIVTKGIGDVPLFVNTEVGKLLAQFRSFALAANQRVMIAGLQQGDTAFLNGTIFAVTAGMAVFALKSIELGRELPDDPEKWIVEGLDRSGLIPIVMEANNAAEKIGAPGLSRLAGAAPASRFASRNIIGSFVGPTAGTIQDAAITTRAIFADDLSKSDVRAMRRLIPYQNLIGMRQVFDEGEQRINEQLGTR